jgi:hypothetical protein
MFTNEQYLAIMLAHGMQVLSLHCKNHIHDMLHVHVCDAEWISDLVVFKHLKVPCCDFSNQIFPDLFSDTFDM